MNIYLGSFTVYRILCHSLLVRTKIMWIDLKLVSVLKGRANKYTKFQNINKQMIIVLWEALTQCRYSEKRESAIWWKHASEGLLEEGCGICAVCWGMRLFLQTRMGKGLWKRDILDRNVIKEAEAENWSSFGR